MGTTAKAAWMGLALSAMVAPASAQLAVSANDAKVRLVDGVVQVVENPPSDSVAIIDMSGPGPRVRATLRVPTSVAGPPVSVAISPDESIALVTAAQRVDPANPRNQVPHNLLTVIDLKADPPVVLQTLTVGNGAAGVSINPAGTLALVANRAEGTVSVLTIAGKTVTVGPKIALGEPNSGPSHAVFTPDGKRALVTRDNDHKISVLAIDGTNVTYTRRDINAGLRPYGIDISSRGRAAVVANIGLGGGDADTISVIDMALEPPRVVDTITVGQTPEGIKISPDGRFVAVVVMEGSNKPAASPFFAARGRVVIYRLNGVTLDEITSAPIGKWSQGVGWSPNGRQLLVQNMVERDIQVFSFNGRRLVERSRIAFEGGPAAIRFAEPPR
jgi:DNA-binding beta-propeller fold protein YncE